MKPITSCVIIGLRTRLRTNSARQLIAQRLSVSKDDEAWGSKPGLLPSLATHCKPELGNKTGTSGCQTVTLIGTLCYRQSVANLGL